MLDSRREATRGFTDACGRAVARLGIGPSAVTLAALPVAGAACVLLALQQYVAAAFVVLLAGCLDFIDGAVARATGRVSRAGGYLDSLVDRAVDFLVLLGIMVGLGETRAWVAGAAALFGTLATSYAKSRLREEQEVPPAMWRGDLLERADRYVLLVPAILLHGVLEAVGRPSPVLFWTLVLLALLTNVTVVQRVWRAWRLLGGSGRGG